MSCSPNSRLVGLPEKWLLVPEMPETIDCSPRFFVVERNRLSANCDVVTHRPITHDILSPILSQVPISQLIGNLKSTWTVCALITWDEEGRSPLGEKGA